MKEKIRLSGSTFAIAQKCPASLQIKFSKKLMTDRDDAAAGTDAHEVIASDIEQVRRFLPEKKKGMTDHIEQDYSAQYKGLTLSGGIDHWTVDADGVLHVTDWKTGPRGIDHLGEDQVLFYAFLLISAHLLSPKRLKVTGVTLNLVSPGLNQKKTFTRSVQEVLDVKERLDLILTALKKKEKPQPGDHCRWCNKRFVCVEFREELKRFADPVFQGPLARITADDLRTLAVAAAAIADIRKYVGELLENGVSIPGVSIQYQNAARIFTDGVDAKMLAEKLGTGPENLTVTKLQTPAQLEKAGFQLEHVQDYITLAVRKVLKVEAGSTKQRTKVTETRKQKTVTKVKK